MLGVSGAPEAQAGEEGCEVFSWSAGELRAALAGATADDLNELMAQARRGTGGGRAFTQAQLMNWLHAPTARATEPAARQDAGVSIF